jgi:hypothetical protein
MAKESEGFAYLSKKFPTKNEIKMKEGIWFGPQIKQPFEDQGIST